ncbi:MAG: hypothetical protein ACJ790_00560, partial [Myxococcaceae bacterium]
VSDTHDAIIVGAGYSRSFVKMDADAPSAFTPALLSQRIKAHQAFGTNGPFVKFTAQKLDGSGNPVGALSGIGDTISAPANQPIELTVDVQAPEFMEFDQIEIYTHAPGRESSNGDQNNNPLVPVASKTLNLATLPLEAVPGLAANFRRIHVTQKFTVTPAADTWYVAVVRSSSAVRQMFPLAWDSTKCTSGTCVFNAGRPYAFTNAILVDADGSGAYDNFPLKPPPPAPLAPKSVKIIQPQVPTVDQLNAVLRALETHKHD